LCERAFPRFARPPLVEVTTLNERSDAEGCLTSGQSDGLRLPQ